MTRIVVTGTKELQRELKALPVKLRKRVLAKSIGRAASIIRREVKRAAPKGPTGNLRKSIKRKKLKGPGITYIIYADRRVAPHFHLVHEGTGDREHSSGKSVGAMPENRFLAIGFERGKGQALKEASARFKVELEKLGKRTK